MERLSNNHTGVLALNYDCHAFAREINIMDNMINMMEKYTNHLEDIVADRTKELQEEKAKTDELLYRMLPRLSNSPVLSVIIF